MSSIWQLIKEGKEKLNAPKKEENNFEEVAFRRLPNPQDEDILKFDNEKEPKETSESLNVGPLLEENKELPEWLSRDDIFEIRKLKNYPIFELHEELVRLEKWLQPTAFDKYIRECIVDDLNAAFNRENFPAEVYPFGSFLTNLYISC